MATEPLVSRVGDERGGAVPLLLTVSTAYIAVTLTTQGFIAMLPLLQGEFAISRMQAGLYSSFYFISATAVAVFAGRVVDRTGSRIGLLIGCCAVGGMMILHGAAPGFGVILALAFVTGIGFTLITPSVSGAVIQNVVPEKRAGSMGIAHGVGGTGALVGTMLLPAIGERFGWRPAIALAGVFAIVIGLFIALFYGRFTTGYSVRRSSNPDPRSLSFVGAFSRLLSQRAFVCACIMGVSFGVTMGSVTSHFAMYMHHDLGFSPALAGFGLGAFHVGGVIGQPSWGIINDRIYRGRRHAGILTLAILSSCVSLVFGLVVSRATPGFPVVVALSFLMGFFVLGTPSLFFTAVTEIAPVGSAGVATGIALVFSRIGVVVGPPLFGLLADATGTYSLSWIVLAVVAVAISGAAMVALHASHAP